MPCILYSDFRLSSISILFCVQSYNFFPTSEHILEEKFKKQQSQLPFQHLVIITCQGIMLNDIVLTLICKKAFTTYIYNKANLL